ncbi:uncharacterized protein LOC113509349 [Galleria mellonella]|uniref:Uncharacterized protein LOC113509349 n=1 Tax=Galleria mellonella TaxID=7137 RepID=A0ABM3N327_GALME|nr:uncharacterized protein LOC113509349 [Galleria mellonella]
MSQWGSLPLLPLRCILDHLSLEDALAAMSTCHHWRAAVLLYEGHKETLKLRAKQLDKNVFLTRMFRKYVKRLHIYIDCNEGQLNKFITFILPQFFDAVKLQEIIFIGPSYIQQNHRISLVKLKRIITESLIFKHLQTIQRLGFMGCGMGAVKNDDERYTHRLVEYYSRPLLSNNESSSADAIFSSCNANIMAFSTLKHIIVDCEELGDSLQWVAALPALAHLTLNVTGRRPLRPLCPPPQTHRHLSIGVNIIALPYKRFEEVIENVLVDGIELTSLKVMFCKTVYAPLLEHVVRLYKESVREVVWADCPSHCADLARRHVRTPRNYDMCNVNPFILLCWQCVQLQRLVIHGYWVWQYDVIGFARLRRSLRALEVSSVYARAAQFGAAAGAALRVLAADAPAHLAASYVQKMNEYTQFEWRPFPWSELPRGLKAHASPAARAALVIAEITRPQCTIDTLYNQ